MSKFNQYCNCRFHTHRTTRVPGLPVSRKVLGRCSGRTEIGFHFSSSLMSNEFREMIKCYQVPRQLERRPAPRKGRVSGPEFKTEAKNYFHWNLFNLEVFVPRSGQMETSSWASSKPVFPVERAFMRPNPETSLSEGWKGFKIKQES